MDWKKGTLKFNWKMNKEKLIFLFCSGLLLFILSLPQTGGEKSGGGSPGEPSAGPEPAENSAGADSSYEKELEERIRSILSRVDGVGQVDVMVALKSTEEKVLRVDRTSSASVSEEKREDGSVSASRQQDNSESTVLNGGSGSSAPIVEKELMPEISGIVISADGGGNAVVKAEISEAMEALFSLPAHKVKVLKRAE